MVQVVTTKWTAKEGEEEIIRPKLREELGAYELHERHTTSARASSVASASVPESSKRRQ